MKNVITRYQDDIEEQLTLDDIDMNFSREFVSWSASQGLSINYTSGNMCVVRVAMSEAYLQGKTKVTDFKKKDFVPTAEVIDQVYLTPSQIEELRNLDISSPKKLQPEDKGIVAARDMEKVMKLK